MTPAAGFCDYSYGHAGGSFMERKACPACGALVRVYRVERDGAAVFRFMAHRPPKGLDTRTG